MSNERHGDVQLTIVVPETFYIILPEVMAVVFFVLQVRSDGVRECVVT